MNKEQLLDYYSKNTKKLNANDLARFDRTICFIINNRFEKEIRIENPKYKRMADLTAEAIVTVKEMQYDIDRMFKKNHKDLVIEEEFTIKNALPVLYSNELKTVDECLSYFEDVRSIAFSVLQNNKELDDKTELMFRSVIQLCTVGYNQFCKVLERPMQVEEVSISFDKPKSRDGGDEYGYYL